MKNCTIKRVLAVFLVVLTVLAMAVPAVAYSGNFCTGRTKDTVYLRNKATSSTSAKYLVEGCNTLPANTAVDVIGVSGTYFKVEYSDYTGYVKISEISVVDGRGTAKEKIILRRTAVNSTKASNRVEGCDSIAKGEMFTITGASGTFFEIKYGIYTGFARMKDVILTAGETGGSTSNNPTSGVPAGVAGTYTDQTGYKPSYTSCTSWTGRVAYMEMLRKEPNASTAFSNMWAYVTGGSTVEVIGTKGTSWLFVKYDGLKGFLPKDKVMAETDYQNKYLKTPTPTANNNTNNTIGTATPAPGATPVPGDVYTAITPNWSGSCKEKVFLRSKAQSAIDGTTNVKRTEIPTGATVTVLGESGSFYYISYGTYVGFARKQDVVQATTPTQPTVTDASGGATGNSSAAQPSGDVWGSIQVPGTNINYKIYSNALKSDGTYKYGGYDYICALTPYNNAIAVISGHNMRNRAGKSNSMFHELHHAQNALSNGAKCERCGAAVGSSSSVFNISYNGSTKWQVVLFYETPVSASDSVKNANLLANGGTTLDAWLKMQYDNCTTYGGTVISRANSSKYMILVTCGDLKGAGTGARLYFVLAAAN